MITTEKFLDFLPAFFMTFLVVTIIAAVFASASNKQEVRRQFENCSNAGGIFIEGKVSNFCVKEFVPMRGKE